MQMAGIGWFVKQIVSYFAACFPHMQTVTIRGERPWNEVQSLTFDICEGPRPNGAVGGFRRG